MSISNLLTLENSSSQRVVHKHLTVPKTFSKHPESQPILFISIIIIIIILKTTFTLFHSADICTDVAQATVDKTVSAQIRKIIVLCSKSVRILNH